MTQDPGRHRIQLVFSSLIVAQIAHSIEEYFGRLYEVFAPARFASNLVSKDLPSGFLIVNIALAVLGLGSLVVASRSNRQLAGGLIWFWVVLELGNGAGHLLLVASRGGYFPGAVTAPFLLLMAVWLGVLQSRRDGDS